MIRFPSDEVVNLREQCFSLCVLLLVVSIMQLTAQGADFSKAKQVYVPPTKFHRAENYETERETQSLKVDVQAKRVVHPTHKLSAAEVTKLRLRAESLIKSRSLEQANQMLKRCFAAQPQNKLVQRDLLKVNLLRSRQYEKTKKLDQAISASHEAIYFAPDNAEAAGLLAQQLKQKGIDPTSASERLMLAQKLYADGKLPDALVEYGQSYKLTPSAAACAGLGNIYLAAGKKDLAQQQYNSALQIDPRCVEAYKQLGLMRLASGDIVEASSYLGKALEFNGSDTVAAKALTNLWQQQVSRSPNSANAHLGLARAYQLSGNFDLARSEYDRVAQIEPNNATLPVARATLQNAVAKYQSKQTINAAQALEAQGAFEEAKNKIGEALASDPKNTELLLLQGEVLEKMGKASDAADAYRAVLYADPNNTEAVHRLKSLSDGKLNFGAMLMPAVEASERAIPPEDLIRLANFLGQLRGVTRAQTKIMEDAEMINGSTKPKRAKKELAAG
jgi:tetratricopeptide (TPR) repeat protein